MRPAIAILVGNWVAWPTRVGDLADGVYTAIHIGGGVTIGNGGISGLGDRALVYDRFFTPPDRAKDRRASQFRRGYAHAAGPAAQRTLPVSKLVEGAAGCLILQNKKGPVSETGPFLKIVEAGR